MKLLPRIALTTLFVFTTITLTSCVCGDAVVENVDTYYKLAKPVEVDPVLAVSGKTVSHKIFGTFDVAEMEYDKLYENDSATLMFKQQGEGKDDYCVITDKKTNEKYYFEFLVHGGRRKSTAVGFTW